jgi:hypothetical protein
MNSTMGRDELAIIITGNLLLLIATILILLRLYTFFYIINRKGGQALLWAVVAWVSGLPY